MKPVDNIRNGLIDKILAIRSKDLLLRLDKLLSSAEKGKLVELTAEQKIMLQMSDNDIANGDLYSEGDLDRQDREWLNGK
ncbi:hypothetical protein JYT72_02285 [Crocinitomix catalasitica]|nr:hypothetical protein [Crocinitomix catalasitica]